MARPLRLQVADGVYHLTARGNERRSIYRDATDKRRFLEILAQTLERFSWSCLSYCLMTNHYHLLVRTPSPNLARGMRDLNGVYAQAFNRRHGRDGHLFQGRYRAILVERDEHLLAVMAYIVRNPVRAGLCARPEEWPWSSQRALLGEHPPGFLALDEALAYLAPTRGGARALYRALTESRRRTSSRPLVRESSPEATTSSVGIWHESTGRRRSRAGTSARPGPRSRRSSLHAGTSRRSRPPTSAGTRCPRSRSTSVCIPRP